MKSYALIFLFAFLLFEGPLELDMDFAPGLSIKNAVLYLLFVLIVIQASVSSTALKFSFVSFHTVFLAILFYAAVSLAVSALGYKEIEYPLRAGFISWKGVWVDRYIFAFVYLYALTRASDAMIVARMLVWIVLCGSALTLIDILNVPDLGLVEERYDGRVNGLIGQPNQFGGFLAFWIPPGIGVYLISKGTKRHFAGLCVLISILLLVLTGSRGAMAATVAGSLLAAVFLRKHLPVRQLSRGAVVVTLVILAVGVIGLTQFTDVVQSRIDRTTSGNIQEVTAGRAYIWADVLSKMSEDKKSFIVGRGWDSIGLHLEQSAHNMYLGILFELGVIGVVLYVSLLLILLNIFRSALNIAAGPARTYIIGVVFSIFFVAVSTAFSELYRPWHLLWAYIGLMLRVAYFELFERPEE